MILGDGHTRDPAATRQLCPQVRNCEDWLRTSGVQLIHQAAYEDNVMHKISQLCMQIFIWLYGLYLAIKLKVSPSHNQKKS